MTACDLAERLYGVYLIWRQQRLREGCAPVDREARTSDLDPPVGMRRYKFVLKCTSIGEFKCACKTEVVREGERLGSY